MSEGCITIIVGEVGNYKTYYAVVRLLGHVAAGGAVWTNIDLHIEPWTSKRYGKVYGGCREYLKKAYGYDLQDGQINKLPSGCWDTFYEHIPPGVPEKPVLVVFDESLEGYDSLDRGDNAKRLRSVLSFVRHCRHHCVDLMYIVQTFSELNNRIRSKATVIIQPRDCAKIRVPVIRLPFPLPFLILIQTLLPATGEVVKVEWWRKDRLVYGAYDTGSPDTTSVKCGGTGRVIFEKPKTQPKHTSLYFAVFASIACCAFMLYRVEFKAVGNKISQPCGAVLSPPQLQLITSNVLQSIAKYPFAYSNSPVGGPGPVRTNKPGTCVYTWFAQVGDVCKAFIDGEVWQRGNWVSKGLVLNVTADYVYFYDWKTKRKLALARVKL